MTIVIMEYKPKIKELKSRAQELELLLNAADSKDERSRLQNEIEALYAQIKELKSDASLAQSISRELNSIGLDD